MKKNSFDLISRSLRFEPGNTSAIDWGVALALLNDLVPAVRTSILPPPAPKKTVFSSQKQATATTSQHIQLQYGTNKNEYRPALQDESILNALLEYRKTIGTEPQSKPLQSFSSQALPRVESAETKPRSFQRTASSSTHPILRPKLDET